jgi:Arc/MetJ-type ribon-helix-helix transcriptional regulator
MVSKKGSIQEEEGGTPVYVRMPPSLLKLVDKTVKKGTYMNRSELIRSGVRLLLSGSSGKGAADGQPADPVKESKSSTE